MYIGFIWLTTSLVILLAACMNRDTHLPSRTRRHGPHTDHLFWNWHCLAVRRSLREGLVVWLSRAKQDQTGPNTHRVSLFLQNDKRTALEIVSSMEQHADFTCKTSPGLTAHRYTHLDVPSARFYWAQKLSTNCQLHYVQVSCFFGQQRWQVRTAMYLPCLKVF